MFVASSQQENGSLGLTLKNRVFFRLWIAALLSVCCVSAHDTAATWLMNALGISPFLLSLTATSALEGTVDFEFQKKLAHSAVKKLKGVTGITNNI
jgi:hypothetical protein